MVPALTTLPDHGGDKGAKGKLVPIGADWYSGFNPNERGELPTFAVPSMPEQTEPTAAAPIHISDQVLMFATSLVVNARLGWQLG
jgi:hypothetical protein